ncbi:MAG: hypothetical protein ACM30I_15185 [Gemmatimonas sp.]
MDTNEITAPAHACADSDASANAADSAQPTAHEEVGRDDERRELILERVYALLWEGLSLRAIAREPNAPTLGTLQRWLAEDDGFHAEYKRIRRSQRETMMDETVAIADEPTDDLSAARLRVAARRWRIDHDARIAARKAAQAATNARDADRRRERARRAHEIRRKEEAEERQMREMTERVKRLGLFRE